MSLLPLFNPPLSPIDQHTPRDRPILAYGPYGWDLTFEKRHDPEYADIGFAVVQCDLDWWEESDADEAVNGLIRVDRWCLVTGNPYSSRMFPLGYIELPTINTMGNIA